MQSAMNLVGSGLGHNIDKAPELRPNSAGALSETT